MSLKQIINFGVIKMNEKNELSLDESIELYNSVGLESRNMSFFGKWVHKAYTISYIPGTLPSFIETLSLDKTKLSIFSILVDDLADNVKIRDKKLLEKSLRIPYEPTKQYQNSYLKATKKLWDDLISSIKKYPRYEEFKDIFFFDLDQFFNSIKYGYIVNSEDMYNLTEGKIYSPNNMMILLFLDMDLMCSPNFDKSELKKIRPVFHHIQDIMHIGNILNTFPREIEELDFSSPIISMGINDGVIKKEDIIKNPKRALKELSYLIPYYKQRVEDNFEKILDHSCMVESIDFKEFYPRLRAIWEGFLHRPHYWKIEETKQKECKKLLNPILKVIAANAVKLS